MNAPRNTEVGPTARNLGPSVLDLACARRELDAVHKFVTCLPRHVGKIAAWTVVVGPFRTRSYGNCNFERLFSEKITRNQEQVMKADCNKTYSEVVRVHALLDKNWTWEFNKMLVAV